MPSKKTTSRKSKESSTPRESIEKDAPETKEIETTTQDAEKIKTPEKPVKSSEPQSNGASDEEENVKESKGKGKGKKISTKGKAAKKSEKIASDAEDEPKTPPKKQDKTKETEEESESDSEETSKKDSKAKGTKGKSKSPKKVNDDTKEGKKEVSSPMKRRIPNIRLDPIPKKLKPIEEKRRRRSIDRLVMVSPAKTSSKFEIPEGKGTKLKKCPNVAAQIAKRTNSDPLLRTIHGLVIGRPNKQVKVKDNLGKFSGLVYSDEDGRANITARIERLKIRTLRDMLAFFGQNPKGDADDLVTRLVDFLEDPQPSDDVYKCSPKSRGLTPTPIKKLKRPSSAFTLYCKDKRSELAKKYPEEKFGEISKRLTDAWKKLGDEDKEEYMGQASKERSKYQRAKKKLELASD